MSELGPEAQEILRNARNGDDPLPGDRTRIHAALMAAIAAGAVTTIASTASASASASAVGTDLALKASVGTAKPVVTSLFGSLVAKGVLVAFLGAAGTGAWLAWPNANSTVKPAAPLATDKPTALLPTAKEQAPPERVADVSEEKPTNTPPQDSTLVSPANPLPGRGAASPPKIANDKAPDEKAVNEKEPTEKAQEAPADSLLAETQRLREAHGALREGDPEKALALLSEQAAETEGQKLREERAAARVFALCKLGRVQEANTEAAAFVAQNPRSPLADRVRKACPSNP